MYNFFLLLLNPDTNISGVQKLFGYFRIKTATHDHYLCTFKNP